MTQELSALGELFTQLTSGAEGVEVARGSVIVEQGSPAEHVFYIHLGQVRLYQIGPDGEERLTEILGPGQWFGCASFAEHGTYATKAVAAAPGQLSKISARTMLNQLASHPDAAVQLIGHLATRLRGAREDAARLQFKDCNQRLIETMLRFSHSAAATTQGSDVVLHLTHAQLAQAVGAARETISLALTELRQRNLVRTGRNRLIFNREALEEASHGEQAIQ